LSFKTWKSVFTNVRFRPGRQNRKTRSTLSVRRTLTGVKLNNNWTQFSRPEIFGSVIKILSRNYTKRKVFRLCLFCEKLRFINLLSVRA